MMKLKRSWQKWDLLHLTVTSAVTLATSIDAIIQYEKVMARYIEKNGLDESFEDYINSKVSSVKKEHLSGLSTCEEYKQKLSAVKDLTMNDYIEECFDKNAPIRIGYEEVLSQGTLPVVTGALGITGCTVSASAIPYYVKKKRLEKQGKENKDLELSEE